MLIYQTDDYTLLQIKEKKIQTHIKQNLTDTQRKGSSQLNFMGHHTHRGRKISKLYGISTIKLFWGKINDKRKTNYINIYAHSQTQILKLKEHLYQNSRHYVNQRQHYHQPL